MSRSFFDHEILVTVGTGGVGKTTLACALGIEGARRGRRVLVLTIDPAKRLADALGVGSLGHEPTDVPRDRLQAIGIDGGGSLAAMMLDTKRTFDEIVHRYAPNPEAAERIFENPVYQHLTDALAGSREYSAMEKLHQLHLDGGYDLIVLDTPPSSHALDFLDAPQRLTGLLGSQFLKLLFRPAVAMGRTGLRLFRLGSSTILRAVSRISGIEFLQSISEFLLAFESMLDGFTARANATQELLRGPKCGFLLVTSPDPVQARRAQEFWARLQEEGIQLLGMVINRIRSWPVEEIPIVDADQRQQLEDALTHEFETQSVAFEARDTAIRLASMTSRAASLARRDQEISRMIAVDLELDADRLRLIPRFGQDVGAIEALDRISSYLRGDVP